MCRPPCAAPAGAEHGNRELWKGWCQKSSGDVKLPQVLTNLRVPWGTSKPCLFYLVLLLKTKKTVCALNSGEGVISGLQCKVGSGGFSKKVGEDKERTS